MKKRRSRTYLDKNVRQSISALLISVVASIVAGSFLGISDELLVLLPGLIILIPGAIDLRGATFSALGSRLSSSLHLGSVTHFSFSNRTVRKNVSASLTLSLTLSVILGISAWLFSRGIGLETMGVWTFIFISVFGGILSGVILMLITFFLSFKTFEKGWDPDNTTAPLIASVGDFITIPIMIFSAYLGLMLIDVIQGISILIILLAFANLYLMFWKKHDYKSIVVQSFFTLLVGSVLSSVSGVFLETNMANLLSIPALLILFPAFIGQNGNIGNIFSSRLATRMHLGELRIHLNKTMLKEIRNSYTLTIIIFPLLAFLAYIAAFLLGLATLGLTELIVFSLAAALLVNTIIIAINFVMGEIAYKWDLDPDNIVVPVMSGIADLVGVVCLLIILVVAGVF